MKRKFHINCQYDYNPAKPEFFDTSIELSEQHKDVNVKELMVRFAQGVPLGVQDNGAYFQSETDPNFSVNDEVVGISDLTDIDRLKTRVQLANKKFALEKKQAEERKKKENPPAVTEPPSPAPAP